MQKKITPKKNQHDDLHDTLTFWGIALIHITMILEKRQALHAFPYDYA